MLVDSLQNHGATIIGPGAKPRFLRVADDPNWQARLDDGLTKAAFHAVAPASQHNRAGWPGMARQFAERFATRARDDWAARFAGTDACVTPVLGWAEAQAQAAALGLFQGGLPRTAPRFSATPCAAPAEAVEAGADTHAVLREIGMEPARPRPRE